MRLTWPLLILFLTAQLTGVSQSGKCYQTVQLNCGDSIADYLTPNEKRNLVKLQLLLEQKQFQVQYLQASAKLDSVHLTQLNQTINQLQQQISLLLAAKDYNDKAYSAMHSAYRKLERQVKLLRFRNTLITSATAVGAFGTGVGIAFLIFKAP
jgi:hypothetical protein